MRKIPVASTNEQNSRRDFFKITSLSGIALVISSTFSFAGKPFVPDKATLNKAFGKLAENQLTGQSKQLPLPYAYNALEPSVDAKTMEIHY